MTTTETSTTAVGEIPRITHRDAMGLALTAYERFADVVEQLGADDWDRPTDCEAWTVRDLVGHVVGAMQSAASLRVFARERAEIRRRLRAAGGGPEDEVAVMTQVQIDRVAELSTAELVATCRRLVPRATAGRRRTPAPARRLVSFPVQMGSIDERWRLGYFVGVILTRDAWLHRVDLCRAVDAELLLTPDHDGRIVADVVAEWARRHGRPFELHLTGPAGGRYVSGPPGPDTEPGIEPAPTIEPPPTIEMDAVGLCRTVSGRTPGSGLLATEVPF